MVRPSTNSSGAGNAAAERAAVAPPAPRLGVLVVTADGDLWTRLSATLADHELRQYDNPAELVDGWRASRPAVVLLDARLEGGLAAAAGAIAAHGTALVPLALTSPGDAEAVAALERQRVLFGHLRLQLDSPALRAAIERASEEAHARWAITASDATSPTPPPPAAGGSRRPLWLAVGAVLLAAVGGAVYWFMAPAATPAQSAPATRAPAAEGAGGVPAATTAASGRGLDAEQVEALLERARAALRERRYVDPANDNALGHYRTVLAADPQNGEARQGLDRIAELLISRAGAALTARDYPAALRSLEAARSIKPDHPSLAALDAQLTERMHDLTLAQIQAALQANAFARAAALMQQAERTGSVPAAQLQQLRQESARREASAQVAAVERLALARIAQGRLLEPADDSAKAYLKDLQSRGGAVDADDLARITESYLRRVAVEARASIARGAFGEVDGWFAELRAAGAPAAQLAALQKEADGAQQSVRAADQQRAAQIVRDRIAARRLLTPDDDSAVRHFRRLAAADPSNAALGALRESLLGALLDEARSAPAGGDGPAALEAARDLGATPAQLAAAQPAPARNAAPVVVTAPKLRQALSPTYPTRAATAGKEGWVDVEFEISATGAVTSARVSRAEPAGIFDQAALGAVQKARFEPAKTADGTPVATSSHLRVRFTLKGTP